MKVAVKSKHSCSNNFKVLVAFAGGGGNTTCRNSRLPGFEVSDLYCFPSVLYILLQPGLLAAMSCDLNLLWRTAWKRKRTCETGVAAKPVPNRFTEIVSYLIGGSLIQVPHKYNLGTNIKSAMPKKRGPSVGCTIHGKYAFERPNGLAAPPPTASSGRRAQSVPKVDHFPPG
jgi:hypothetical protein